MCVCFSFQRSKLSKFEDFNSQPKFSDLDINQINTNIYSDLQFTIKLSLTEAKVWLYKTETSPSKIECTSGTEGVYFSFQKPNNKTNKFQFEN